MTIIVGIVAVALGGIKMGVASREIGEQKADTYQRLRFIQDQMARTIRSFHPLFYDPDQGEDADTPAERPKSRKKLMAFEGLRNSIRFVSFADTMTAYERKPLMHEVQFYLGEKPGTEDFGVIMMEREIAYDDVFSTPDPQDEATRYILLAKNVSDLSFRYYKVDKLSQEELEFQEDEKVKFQGEWIDEVIFQVEEVQDEINSAARTQVKENKIDKKDITMPRAIEVSLSLTPVARPGKEDDEEETKPIELPTVIIPFNNGIEFIRTVVETDEEEAGDETG